MTDADEIKNYLASIGIDYERWENVKNVSPDASANEILEAYADEIEKMKLKGGYQTADVIDIKNDTPNLEPMLEKFRPEHFHDEDEVRFIVKGCGIFHIAPENGGDVTAVKMTAGDMIRVPRGTKHWFDLGRNANRSRDQTFSGCNGLDTALYGKRTAKKNTNLVQNVKVQSAKLFSALCTLHFALCTMKVILLDIEGTTTPIDFVHKTLFPYAKKKIGEYVAENFDEIKTEIEQLKTEYKKDFSNQIYGRNFNENAPETISEYLKFLIETDRKSTPLKSLQGKIWQKGYESGELESVMFDDIPKAFEKWKSENKTIADLFVGQRSRAKTDLQIFEFRRSDRVYFKLF